jgi:autotransporter-associated beta strand protein
MTDTTWLVNAPNGNYNDSTNWDLGTPTDGDNALFGTSSTVDITVTGSADVGAWVFKPGASQYVFTLPDDSGVALRFTGAGITGFCYLFPGYNTIVEFLDKASAGDVYINNQSGESTLFFLDSSTAGQATIYYTDILFDANSSAGYASIVGYGNIAFYSDSHAGHATILTSGGTISFFDHSNGGNARLQVYQLGTIDFSETRGPAGNGHVTAGSIEGIPGPEGQFGPPYGDVLLFLGHNQLTVGSNNLSTDFGGLIEDGGRGGGTGGSLVKVGQGTWRLDPYAPNTFSGGIRLEHGTLDLAAPGASGTGHINFVGNGKAKLAIDNAAFNGNVFGNTIGFFGKHDVLDLTGLNFVHGATATYHKASHQLSVDSGGVTYELTLHSPHGTHFEVASDHHGGTNVFLVFA